jgi:hypothetical protein
MPKFEYTLVIRRLTGSDVRVRANNVPDTKCEYIVIRSHIGVLRANSGEIDREKSTLLREGPAGGPTRHAFVDAPEGRGNCRLCQFEIPVDDLRRRLRSTG